MRRVNAETIEHIKRWEGLRLAAYQDTGGVWTIGWGHTGPEVVEGLKITKAKAEALLRADLDIAADAVLSAVKVDLTENQLGALVSFAFNVGGAAFKGSTLLRKLNAGDYAAVPGEMARWNKVRNPKTGRLERDPGVANRRAAEIGLWSKGAHVAGAAVTVAPEKAPISKGDMVASVGALGTAGTVVDAISENAGTISNLSWLMSGQGVVAIIAGVALVGLLGWLGYSYWKRGRA